MQVNPRTDAIYTVIYAPTYKQQLSYSGYVRAFSSSDEVGPYDILPGHENFVTVAVGNTTLLDDKGQKHSFDIGRAVVEVSENVLKVFVDY